MSMIHSLHLYIEALGCQQISTIYPGSWVVARAQIFTRISEKPYTYHKGQSLFLVAPIHIFFVVIFHTLSFGIPMSVP